MKEMMERMGIMEREDMMERKEGKERKERSGGHGGEEGSCVCVLLGNC